MTTPPPTPPAPSSYGPFARLVRSLSKKDISNIPLPPQEIPSKDPHATNAAQSSSSGRKIPKQKLNAFERFMKITKMKKDGDQEVEFPPASWFEEPKPELEPGGPHGQSQPRGDGASNIEPPALSLVAPSPSEGSQDRDQEKSSENTTEEHDNDMPSPEPTTLAQRIQALISSLPLPYASTSTLTSNPESTTPSTSSQPPPYSSERPLPPAVLTASDSSLVPFLTSASVMNGSLARGRQSVWSALDKLRAPYRRGDGKQVEQVAEGGGEEKGKRREDDMEVESESVMMYSPLIPTRDSEVELAESEVMSVEGDAGESYQTWGGDDGNGEVPEKKDPVPSPTADQGKRGGGVWPFTTSNRESHETVVKEVKVWIPSSTKISLQVMWWGYRLYLPPPVLDVLNNKQLEAAKRAAMITAALKWLLDHLPVKLMPPQFRPLTMVLKRLIPYLGYIGGFIAWSWSGIKSFDKGNGVILTATWLLPVALIPGTWEFEQLPAEPTNEAESSRKKSAT